MNSFRDINNTTIPNKPRAWLNWIMFDEQIQYVSNGNGAQPVGNADLLTALAPPPLTVPRNVFLYIYVSNETQGWDMFFDNLSVRHYSGTLLEETHYYPFGLVMQGISSRALNNVPENRKKFNGIEHTTEFELNTYDAFFRSTDPQIGRWWQIDPKPNMAESPYSMMGINPISNADPLGDTLRGSSNQDARRLQRIIRQTFRGREMKAVRQMFQRRLHEGDRQTFAGIVQWQVNQATAKLSADQRSLVEGYVDAIITSYNYHGTPGRNTIN